MNSSQITFKNQPKLSTDVVDEKFNKRRMALIPVIESYLSASKHFTGDVTVTFSHKGISSLVCFVESTEGKKVLKIALSISHSRGEAQFLKVWEQVGVKVPHVFDAGVFGDHPYTLMEYIDAVPVGEMYTHRVMIDKGLYVEMGTILRRMHEPRGKGYGMVFGDRGEYNTFQEWIDGPDMQKRITYVAEHTLLPDIWSLFPQAIHTLVEYIGKESTSSYCHDDFGGNNILAIKPLTVFDPNSRFNNGYVDVGRTMIIYIAQGIFPEEILTGYFGTKERNNKVLYASMFLNIVMKLPYSHKKGRLDVIKNWEEYLVSNKNLLE